MSVYYTVGCIDHYEPVTPITNEFNVLDATRRQIFNSNKNKTITEWKLMNEGDQLPVVIEQLYKNNDSTEPFFSKKI